MTFLELINYLKDRYDNKNVNNSIIFFVSKKVKNPSDLILKRHQRIDFGLTKIEKYLNQYYFENKPLGQITHSIHFNNLDIKINKKVHCPRNETELLVHKIRTYFKKDKKLINVIDLCAGTGCIGISLKNEFKKINLTLLDVDNRCIKNIKKNLINNNLKAKVIKQDFFKFISANKDKYDVILMNPPYVDPIELDDSLVQYETNISFTNSKNPLDFYESLFENLSNITNKHFLIGLEFGYNQKIDMKKLIERYNLSKFTKFYKDLNNLDRFLIIYK